MALVKPKAITVTVPGANRLEVGNAILDRSIELDRSAGPRRKNSPEQIRLQTIAGELRSIANKILCGD